MSRPLTIGSAITLLVALMGTLTAAPIVSANGTNTLPEGFHDGSTLAVASHEYCYANGWAIDPDDVGARLEVRILADGAQVWAGTADAFRPDWDYLGDGYNGFWVPLDGLVTPDVPHEIRVLAQDANSLEWVSLSQTPRLITCTHLDGFLDTSGGVADRAGCVAEGWAADLDTPTGPRVQVRVSVDGRIVAETTADLFREDVLAAGYGDGYSGWSVDLFGKLTPGPSHHVIAEARDTTAKKLWVTLKEFEGIDLTCLAH